VRAVTATLPRTAICSLGAMLLLLLLPRPLALGLLFQLVHERQQLQHTRMERGIALALQAAELTPHFAPHAFGITG